MSLSPKTSFTSNRPSLRVQTHVGPLNGLTGNTTAAVHGQQAALQWTDYLTLSALAPTPSTSSTIPGLSSLFPLETGLSHESGSGSHTTLSSSSVSSSNDLMSSIDQKCLLALELGHLFDQQEMQQQTQPHQPQMYSPRNAFQRHLPPLQTATTLFSPFQPFHDEMTNMFSLEEDASGQPSDEEKAMNHLASTLPALAGLLDSTRDTPLMQGLQPTLTNTTTATPQPAFPNHQQQQQQPPVLQHAPPSFSFPDWTLLAQQQQASPLFQPFFNPLFTPTSQAFISHFHQDSPANTATPLFIRPQETFLRQQQKRQHSQSLQSASHASTLHSNALSLSDEQFLAQHLGMVEQDHQLLTQSQAQLNSIAPILTSGHSLPPVAKRRRSSITAHSTPPTAIATHQELHRVSKVRIVNDSLEQARTLLTQQADAAQLSTEPGLTEEEYESKEDFTNLISVLQGTVKSGEKISLQVYRCPWPHCEKSFARFTNLRVHYRTHSGERPFACTECSMTFARNHDLKRHRRVHLGTKPFQCATCQKTFSRLDAMNRHMKLNEACGFEYARQLASSGVPLKGAAAKAVAAVAAKLTSGGPFMVPQGTVPPQATAAAVAVMQSQMSLK